MSKYTSLCKAYREAVGHYRDYETVCGQFMHNLVEGVIDYFECPREKGVLYSARA
jgi:hypothetical protein